MCAPIIYSGGVQYVGFLDLEDGWWIVCAFPSKPGEGFTKLLMVKRDEVKEDPV